jgi:hypothetical protein
MLGAGHYPITVAESLSYAEDADEIFSEEEHERLKERLAFWPDSGDIILGTGGVRRLLWPYKDRSGQDSEALILYFFRDLNMPLFLVALFAGGDCEFDDESRGEMAALVDQLLSEYAKRWARSRRKPDSSA